LYTDVSSSGGNNFSGDENITNDNTPDVDCAPTLGFRGEALFCLANISRSLTVSTRSAEDNDNNSEIKKYNANQSKLGEQFEFDSNGQILPTSIKRIPLSHLTGTTVTVRGLFESLPVRRVDMCKRIKVQRMKLMKMMQGYAILCLGTQFNLTDILHGQSNNNNTKSSSNSGRGGSKMTSKHKIEVRLATSESSKTLESRVASVLGTKFLSGLTRIDINLSKAVPLSSTSTNTILSTNDNVESRWKVQGLISYAPASPHSANARELQFFGINGRPVDLPSVSRLLGDVWRMFDPTSSTEGGGDSSNNNGRRRPACVLAFTLPNNMYDVNLSPDKREVMFTEEAILSELIREGLMKLWSSQSEGKFEANEVESRSNKNVKGGGHDDECKITNRNDDYDDETVELTQGNERPCNNDIDEATPKLRRRNMESDPIVTPVDVENPMQNEVTQSSSQLRGDESDAAFDEKASSGRDKLQSIPPQNTTEPNTNDIDNTWTQMQLPERARTQERKSWNQSQINFQRIQKAESRSEVDRILTPDDEHDDSNDIQQNDNDRPANNRRLNDRSTMERPTTRRELKRLKRQTKQDVTSFLDSFAYGAAKSTELTDDDDSEGQCDSDESVQPEESSVVNIVDSRKSAPTGIVRTARMVVGKTVTSKVPPPRRRNVRAVDTRAAESHHRNDVESGKYSNSQTSPPVVWNSFSGTHNVVAQSQHARLIMRNTRKYVQTSSKRKREGGCDQDELGGTSNDDGNLSSKRETVDLCKEDFLHMSIIGQFNLGFILARCRNHNLWILDQHACDEKYNFERLCKETVIHEQTLIAPLPLDLSPSEEHCVLEHMDDFERNGFRFSYDPEKDPRHRLSLTALPHSGSGGDGKKAVQFGKEDVGALCAMLGADGTSSSEGYHAGFGTGAEGGRIAGVNAVRRYAGLSGGVSYSQGSGKSDGIVGSSIVRLPKAIAMFASRACRVSEMFDRIFTADVILYSMIFGSDGNIYPREAS
jgi:DNA mismatch repair protein PMS2